MGKFYDGVVALQKKAVQFDDDVATVMPIGRLDIHAAIKIKDDLGAAFRHGCTAVVFDLEKVDYIENASIKTFERVIDAHNPESVAIRNATGKVYTVINNSDMACWLED